ncbi:MAG TPA: BamA/TamA family outer membrane protein [Chryseolinea sp.]|nr:BamA/TamA family outer membrane protein [Chryseolinea sp.]
MQKQNNILHFRILGGPFVPFIVLCIAVVFSGCQGTKFLKDGEALYTGSKIHFETTGRRVGRKKVLEKELQDLITPKPNSTVLGMRPGVWFYYVAGTPKKKKGLKSFIKNKLGQPPVLMSEINPERTAKVLEAQLFNEGYFKSSVSGEAKTKGKEGKAIYTVKISRPYRLDSIRYPNPRDSVYASIIRTLKEESLLKPRQRYDLARMQAEQERIEEKLENYGFYYFDDRFLIFEADSTVGRRQDTTSVRRKESTEGRRKGSTVRRRRVDLDLKLEPGIPRRARRIYSINQVTVFPNYSLTDTLKNNADTVVIDSINFVDSTRYFRPTIITRVINIKKGTTYSREDQELTLSHLMGLGVFKFVNIKYSEAFPDSTLLNANIYLTPLQKKSLRAEVQAVSKSNNFVGPGLSFTFTNRNFLRGAELFQLSLSGAYEVQVGRQNQGPLNSFETGLETSLTVPRFISPIRIDYNSRKYLPKTVFKVGFNFQNRVGYYRLNSLNVNYGYIWRESAAKSHELYPADISFVRTDKKSQAFIDMVQSNPILENSFENQFIIGARYAYTLNTQLNEDPMRKFERKKFRTHNFYFNGNVDIAGNLIHGVQNMMYKSSEEPYDLFGAPYSQFVKGDVDFRYYYQLDEHNKLATRFITGVGYAYSNSTTLPYIKQFSIGGSSSIRAFPARSIGPGSYNVRENIPEDSTLFIDQRGDIKLEGSAEYRFDIFKSLKGAVFVDAGNIWLMRADTLHRPGGEFNVHTFLDQIAVGTGVGLRFDFSFFVLRFDLAFPLRKPYLEDAWVTDEIDFGSSAWRKENLIFNIAIGYPF